MLPHEVKEVTFKAYCLDFDLENPAATDSLAVQLVPPNLSEIIDNLLAYEQTAWDQEESTVPRSDRHLVGTGPCARKDP